MLNELKAKIIHEITFLNTSIRMTQDDMASMDKDSPIRREYEVRVEEKAKHRDFLKGLIEMAQAYEGRFKND